MLRLQSCKIKKNYTEIVNNFTTSVKNNNNKVVTGVMTYNSKIVILVTTYPPLGK